MHGEPAVVALLAAVLAAGMCLLEDMMILNSCCHMLALPVNAVESATEVWHDVAVMQYLQTDVLPVDSNVCKRVARRASLYCWYNQ